MAPYLVRHVPDVVAKDALEHNWQSYSRTMRNVIFSATTPEWLAGFAGEVLLVHGKNDKIAPFANVEQLGGKQHVQLFTLEADHGLIFTHGSLIAQRLESFLR
jgi:pimeloyl-ACP methyl ester carboxylesterase